MKNLALRSALVVCLVQISLAAPHGAGAQTLETETARMLPSGALQVNAGVEIQTSSEGREIALPLAVELGITDRLELLAEPVPYTAIQPNVGRHAVGAGDLELTMTYLLSRARNRVPAFAIAGEAKVPIASDTLIGTGKADYAVYLIGSELRERFATHAFVSYTFLGKPTGVSVSNIIGFALAEEIQLNARYQLFSEVLGNTASGGGENAPVGQPESLTPELAGGELVATVGLARTFASGLDLSLSVSYDNNQAVLLKPGFSFRVR